jgi:hypothetical protein
MALPKASALSHGSEDTLLAAIQAFGPLTFTLQYERERRASACGWVASWRIGPDAKSAAGATRPYPTAREAILDALARIKAARGRRPGIPGGC